MGRAPSRETSFPVQQEGRGNPPYGGDGKPPQQHTWLRGQLPVKFENKNHTNTNANNDNIDIDIDTNTNNNVHTNTSTNTNTNTNTNTSTINKSTTYYVINTNKH